MEKLLKPVFLLIFMPLCVYFLHHQSLSTQRHSFTERAEAPEDKSSDTIRALAEAEEITDARLVPGGQNLVYASDKSGTFELWLRSAGGGLKQLTNLKQRVENPRVSPDGKVVVFGSDQGGDERYRLYKIDLKSGVTQLLPSADDISRSSQRFSPDGKMLAFEADPDTPFRPQLFTMELDTGKVRRLTEGSLPVYQPVWSRDGARVAGTRTGDDQNGSLMLVSLLQGKSVEIKPPEDGRIIWPLEFSPDDQYVLGVTLNGEGFRQLVLIEVLTGRARRIGPSNYDVGEASWGPHSSIFFTQNLAGRYRLLRMDDPDKREKVLVEPRGVISNLEFDETGKLLFIREDSTTPSEIFQYDIAARRMDQLTHSKTGALPSNLSPAVPFKVSSFDGTPIEGFLFEPRKGAKKPYPAVAVIHGGPDYEYSEYFDARVQALTLAGFAVIAPNYRGSTGFGRAFQDLNKKDWGGGDRKDVKSVLQYFVEHGEIDRRRIGIMGGSYGGYMTLISLVKDSDFYAAGAEAFGMPDLVEDYNVSKDRFGLWYQTQMGTPDENTELFADRSAINFLGSMKAPLIVFQGPTIRTSPGKRVTG